MNDLVSDILSSHTVDFVIKCITNRYQTTVSAV